MGDREKDIFLKVLQKIAENPDSIDNDERVKSLIAKVYKQGRKQQKKSQQLQEEVVMREADKYCFICQEKFSQEHDFYRDTCLKCGNLNYAKRYAKETDFPEWCDRLHIYGLDLRHLESVEYFTRHILNCYLRLDIIVNNAAQTVRRPINYYRHLIDFESLSLPQLPKSIR